jgi:hypothetical protein
MKLADTMILGEYVLECTGVDPIVWDISGFAVLREAESPDGTGDYWHFWDDGSLLSSGSFNAVTSYIANEWEPIED